MCTRMLPPLVPYRGLTTKRRKKLTQQGLGPGPGPHNITEGYKSDDKVVASGGVGGVGGAGGSGSGASVGLSLTVAVMPSAKVTRATLHPPIHYLDGPRRAPWTASRCPSPTRAPNSASTCRKWAACMPGAPSSSWSSPTDGGGGPPTYTCTNRCEYDCGMPECHFSGATVPAAHALLDTREDSLSTQHVHCPIHEIQLDCHQCCTLARSF